MSGRGGVEEKLAVVRDRRTGSEKVPYPIRIRELQVLRSRMVGSALLRVTFGGEGLAGFVSHCPDEHVRLIFPEPDGSLRLPEPDGDMLRWPRPVPRSREYTVRRHDADAGELDIDIALHRGGLASDWAVDAAPGDTLHVAGPPGGLAVPHGYDRWLLAGDITALPAIARWLEGLPSDARGWAFVEVTDASEEIEIAAPAGVSVRWVHRGGVAPGLSDALEKAVREVRVPDGERVYAWIAGEAGSLKPLRRWVRDELGLAGDDHEITGYWKRGTADFDDDEEEHGHGH
ncbi:NADPH-dependent ferric siderophore reductase [Pseudonocardia sediminis]|uniref:NADPH-dependent ferric siderophore reductase n=1 Tax=Pseudonocardia sediminis TaxID=1397368 RepID=A0A4Q7UY30_PSEST|nr:siderophore-interacting protein [Pseudonocardia sediminis]RZT85871.1 NADPH-dependent ferric siderophore reductase [Pseudonocardia sediminis]